MKYKPVQNKATSLKGDSAGQDPNHVNRKKLEINLQKSKRAIGEKLNPLKNKFLEDTEKANNTITAKTKPRTPPNLLGIERKIA